MIMYHTVGILKTAASYSTEWMDQDNFPEKEALRSLGRLMGYSDGNMLRNVAKPGNNVVVKPNWVLSWHLLGYDIYSMITHPAVLRAVIDLVYEAIQGHGSIAVVEAPQGDCDFSELLKITCADNISRYYWDKYHFEIPIIDLRQEMSRPNHGIITVDDRLNLPGDPQGYAVVNLGPSSAFKDLPNTDKYYGADYDRSETIHHHIDSRHEYLVSKSVLNADAVIHVPKLKVHKKVGVTLNAKGMVGINGNKNWIAHFRIGPPSAGGDEFPDTEPGVAKNKARFQRFMIDHFLAARDPQKEKVYQWVRSLYRRIKPALGKVAESKVSIEGGDWYGNDTAWRMTADLARAVLFANRDGDIQAIPQRNFYSIVDGIVAGDKEGPLAPTPKQCGVLMAGSNMLAVDIAATRLMGFDWTKVKYLKWLISECGQKMELQAPEEQIQIASNISEWSSLLQDVHCPDLAFEPHPMWKGHIELNQAPEKHTVQ